MNDKLANTYKDSQRQLFNRVKVLEQALEQISELPFVTEESAWTWSDISKKQTEIARVALEDNALEAESR
jgi:hypothetical protein